MRTRVRMSLALRGMLDCGELDAAIVQAFAYEVRRTDLVMLREGLHWVKSPDLVLPEGGPLSFLSFDGECFYRHWALDIGQDDEALMEAVFESGAGRARRIWRAPDSHMAEAELDVLRKKPADEVTCMTPAQRQVWAEAIPAVALIPAIFVVIHTTCSIGSPRPWR